MDDVQNVAAKPARTTGESLFLWIISLLNIALAFILAALTIKGQGGMSNLPSFLSGFAALGVFAILIFTALAGVIVSCYFSFRRKTTAAGVLLLLANILSVPLISQPWLQSSPILNTIVEGEAGRRKKEDTRLSEEYSTMKGRISNGQVIVGIYTEGGPFAYKAFGTSNTPHYSNFLLVTKDGYIIHPTSITQKTSDRGGYSLDSSQITEWINNKALNSQVNIYPDNQGEIQLTLCDELVDPNVTKIHQKFKIENAPACSVIPGAVSLPLQ